MIAADMFHRRQGGGEIGGFRRHSPGPLRRKPGRGPLHDRLPAIRDRPDIAVAGDHHDLIREGGPGFPGQEAVHEEGRFSSPPCQDRQTVMSQAVGLHPEVGEVQDMVGGGQDDPVRPSGDFLFQSGPPLPAPFFAEHIRLLTAW